LLLAAKKGETIPLDWATDAAGRPTDDPTVAFEGYEFAGIRSKSVVDRRGVAPLTLARRVPSQWSQHPVSWRVTAGSRRIVLHDRGAGVRRERETQMDWNIIEGKWKELKGHAREEWGKLTDDELEEVGGKKDRLVGKLQQKYGYAADEADRRADEWAKRQDAK